MLSSDWMAPTCVRTVSAETASESSSKGIFSISNGQGILHPFRAAGISPASAVADAAKRTSSIPSPRGRVGFSLPWSSSPQDGHRRSGQ